MKRSSCAQLGLLAAVEIRNWIFCRLVDVMAWQLRYWDDF